MRHQLRTMTPLSQRILFSLGFKKASCPGIIQVGPAEDNPYIREQ